MQAAGVAKSSGCMIYRSNRLLFQDYLTRVCRGKTTAPCAYLCRRKQQRDSLLLRDVEGIFFSNDLSQRTLLASAVNLPKDLFPSPCLQNKFRCLRKSWNPSKGKKTTRWFLVKEIAGKKNPSPLVTKIPPKRWVSRAEMAEEMFGGSLRLLLGTDAAVLCRSS